MKKSTAFVGLGAGFLLITVVSMAMGDKNPHAKKVEADSAQMSGSVAAIAQLGDQYIEADELQALLADLPQGSAERLGQNRPAIDDWLRSRLAEKKLLSEAVAQGWDQREEIQQMARSATEQIVLRTYLDSVSQVPEDYPSEAELNAAYEINKGQWATPAMYQVSQIFLAVNDQGSLEDARKRAVELTKAAREGQADFAELAREYSEDPQSAQQGGDIGMRPLELLIPEIRPVLVQLEVGAVSDPVQTPRGLHVLKLSDMQPAGVAALDQVREQLRNNIRVQRKDLVAKAYMEGLINADTFSIDGPALNVVLGKAE